MNSFRCPQCDQRLKARSEQAGQVVRCPSCNALLRIPSEPEVVKSPSIVAEVEMETEREGALSRPSMKIDVEELIDMTAMVDIVFFLLIFFLVTSMSAIQSSAPLPRPESQDDEKGGKAIQSEDPRNDSNAIVVKINKDDSIEIDGVPFRDFSDVVVRLHQLRNAGGNDTSLMIVGHGDATHGTAVSILDAGYEVGIDHLRFAVLGDATD